MLVCFIVTNALKTSRVDAFRLRYLSLNRERIHDSRIGTEDESDPTGERLRLDLDEFEQVVFGLPLDRSDPVPAVLDRQYGSARLGFTRY